MKATRKGRNLTPAILVKTKAEDFPALARKLRSDTYKLITGGKVVNMRQTRKVDMLIEVAGDEKSVSSVRDEIARVAGEGVSVNEISRKGLIEIRDVDSWSSRDEVLLALAEETEVSTELISIISLRKTYGGAQTAVAVLPLRAADKLAESGRVRIGLVNCRVRIGEQRTRCFKCLALGHTHGDCVGPDRREKCR